MAGWLTKKLRSGRYLMNLKLLEAELAGSSSQHHAEVIVAAAGMLAKLQADDFIAGIQLERAAFESMSASPQDIEALYDALEDVLNLTEAQRKQLQNASGQLGIEAARDMDRRVEIQQQGLRLILVSLARKADDGFKAKAKTLQRGFFSARDAIEGVISKLRRQDELVASLGIGAATRDYESMKVKAKIIAFSFVTW